MQRIKRRLEKERKFYVFSSRNRRQRKVHAKRKEEKVNKVAKNSYVVTF